MPDTNSEGGVRGGPKRRLTTGSGNHRDQRSSCKKKKRHLRNNRSEDQVKSIMGEGPGMGRKT